MALGCVPAMPTMACTLRLFSVERLRIQTSSGRNRGTSPSAVTVVQGTSGKGVGEVVSGVGKSVQHQAAFAQPQKDLKPAVGVAFPAAEQGAEMQQRICRGSE